MIFYISCRVASLYAVYYSFVTGEGRVPRCRRECSPVPSPLLPGAGEMPRLEGVWDGGMVGWQDCRQVVFVLRQTCFGILTCPKCGLLCHGFIFGF